ncbi:MAG: hypothetical protein LBU37_12220, partial [Tannerellaceae bacterium]|nr:hypothetical protein [Tannerellaceae bacterium]
MSRMAGKQRLAAEVKHFVLLAGILMSATLKSAVIYITSPEFAGRTGSLGFSRTPEQTNPKYWIVQGGRRAMSVVPNWKLYKECPCCKTWSFGQY